MTPATAFTVCWQGKTREAPTGTAKEASRTPNPATSVASTSLRVAPSALPPGPLRKRQLFHPETPVEAAGVGGEGGQGVEQAWLERSGPLGHLRGDLPSPPEAGQGP